MRSNNKFTGERLRAQHSFEKRVARYILGETDHLELTGTQQQIHAVSSVAELSKAVLQSLHENQDLHICIDLLSKKHEAAENFKQTFGFSWLF
jgi:hypothetical protein